MLQKKYSIEKTIFVTVIFGTAFCTFIGLLFFGLDVFNTKHVAFQFLAYGIAGSISFAMFRQKRFRDLIFLLLLLFLLNLVIVDISEPSFVITHLIFFAAVVFGIYLFAKYFYSKLENLRIARLLILASILSVMFVAATTLLWFIFSAGESQTSFLRNLPLGFLIGLGLGVGFEVAERSKKGAKFFDGKTHENK